MKCDHGMLSAAFSFSHLSVSLSLSLPPFPSLRLPRPLSHSLSLPSYAHTPTPQLYSTTLWFYVLFFFVHMITTFVVTVEIYYCWQIDVKQSFIQVFKLMTRKINALCKRKQEMEIEGEGEDVPTPESNERQSIIQLFQMYRKEGLCPPKHMVNSSNFILYINLVPRQISISSHL